jgi:hypothetical protein
LARYRKKLIEDRARETQRLHKVLEDGGIKLDSVASNALGASGRTMIEALIAGQRDPQVLAELAKGRLRRRVRTWRWPWSAGSPTTTPRWPGCTWTTSTTSPA